MDFEEHHPVHQAMVFVANTEAYFQAVALCPQVIVAESPHEQFLEFCKYDIWAAAQRLANHWTMRCEAFGPALAFVPLHQALSEREWGFLCTQFYRWPVRMRDKQGRRVEFIDREKIGPRTWTSLLRCQWVLYSLLINEPTLTQSVPFATDDAKDNQQSKFDSVVICRVNRSRLGPTRHDKSFYTFFKRARDHALCIRYVHYHMVMPDPPHGASLFWFKTMALRGARSIAIWPNIATTFHLGTDTQVLQSLVDFGFTKAGLPVALGGEWDADKEWPEWVRQWRCAQERPRAQPGGRGLLGDTKELDFDCAADPLLPCCQLTCSECERHDADFPLAFHEISATDLLDESDYSDAGLLDAAQTPLVPPRLEPEELNKSKLDTTDRIPLFESNKTSASMLVCCEQDDRKRRLPTTPKLAGVVEEVATSQKLSVILPSSTAENQQRTAARRKKDDASCPLLGASSSSKRNATTATMEGGATSTSNNDSSRLSGNPVDDNGTFQSTVQLLMASRRKARNKTNARYYHRKRVRDKSKLTKQQEYVQQLTADNQELSKDNERLEQLLESVKRHLASEGLQAQGVQK